MCYGNQKGVALLAVIFFLVVMAFVGIIFISLSSTNTAQSVNEVYSSQALSIAEGGLERAGRYLIRREGGTCTTCTCSSINGNGAFTNTQLGSGQFTVAAGLNSTTTTLSALTGATDFTVPVGSVANYGSFGQIRIDREMINYTAIGTTASACTPSASPCFTGAIRGADGTTAMSHISGTPVAQTQCLLTSTGGVSAISAGSNQRVVSQADVVQYGWAVGINTGSNQPEMLSWNGTLWSKATGSAPANVGNLTSVSMTSAADGWAVSDNSATGGANNQGYLLQWNGSAWSVPAVPGNPSKTSFYAVFMNLFGDGWTVGTFGNAAPQQPRTLYWNGSSWGDTTSNLSIKKNLNSVYCNSVTDCWSVGDPTNGGALLIIHWPGGSTWTTPPTPALNLSLRSVHCSSFSDCWTVGDFGTTASYKPLMVHYTTLGGWIVPGSALNLSVNLRSVFCNTVSSCWAVGDGGTIIFWNGMAWSSTSSPVAVNLRSVTCITSMDCWAVGDSGTLIHYDGSSWSQDPQSGVLTTFQLNSVSIIGPKRANIGWREVVQ